MSTNQPASSESLSHRDPMNFSNANYDKAPERIERSRDDVQSRNDALEGALKGAPSPVKKTPGTQLLAASALTSLKPDAEPDERAPEEDDEECGFQIPVRFTKSGRRRATPFPMKLMKVLSLKKYSNIITWTPDGRSFTILRPKAFTTEVLPKYFKEAKYSSFTRKLHRWGFQRHLRGADTGAFFHKYFQRGRIDLLDNMTCYKPRDSHPFHAMNNPMQPMAMGLPPSTEALLFQSNLMNQGQRPMMSTEMIAEAQAVRRQQQQQQLRMLQQQQQQQQQQSQQSGRGEMMDAPPGSPYEDRLNAAIELEVTRRLQERVQAASLSRQALAMMQSPQGQQDTSFEGGGVAGMPQASSFPSASSPARGPGMEMGMLEKNLAARVQQAAALRLARGGYDDSPQQYFDPNLEGARGA